MKRNQSGFTLIEIAIVLVIIGLLLGGVMKGQELINSAKVKSLATDFRNIPVLVYGYQDKFRALPGDDNSVVAHLPGSIAPTPCAPAATAGKCVLGNGIIEGAWNAANNATNESIVFWQHVRLAGLLAGSTTVGAADYLPVNSAGGAIGIQSGTNAAATSPVLDIASNAIRGTYIICSPNILGKFARQIDIQLDDGNTSTGSMLSVPTTGYALGQTAVANTAAAWDDASIYTVCMGV